MWGHIDTLTINVMCIDQILFQIKGNFTGKRNVGHCDLHLFWRQKSDHTES